MVENIKDYTWTNYKDYIENRKTSDINFVLNMFNAANRECALISFAEYVNRDNGDECMDISEKQRLTDEEAIKTIKLYCKDENVIDLQRLEINKRNLHIGKLKKEYNLSIRQIERITGISRGIIQKA